jgi:bile acid:Na+ symporter, BASS family
VRPGPGAVRDHIERAVAAIQSNILWVLLGVYVLAGVLPGAGLAIKKLQVGSVGLFGERPVALSLTNLLLASMLFTAGLGVSLRDVRGIFQHPRLLAAGVLANALMPVLFLALLSLVLQKVLAGSVDTALRSRRRQASLHERSVD